MLVKAKCVGVQRFLEASAIDLSEYSHKGRKDKRGLFYHKGGAGIENNPHSKRQPNDAFNIRKVKGKMEPRRNIIVREKSKWEKNNPFTGW
jgi:hypothetical protein